MGIGRFFQQDSSRRWVWKVIGLWLVNATYCESTIRGKMMKKAAVSHVNVLQCNSIGFVKGPENGFRLELYDKYRDGLKNLEQFSHVQVIWWADRNDNDKGRECLVTELPYAKGEDAGVFACRSEFRPNPVGITVCPILSVDQESGVVHLAYIDALDSTPIIDLKPYIPVSDRVRDVSVPHWFSKWPEWYEDAGKFFSEEFSEE